MTPRTGSPTWLRPANQAFRPTMTLVGDGVDTTDLEHVVSAHYPMPRRDDQGLPRLDGQTRRISVTVSASPREFGHLGSRCKQVSTQLMAPLRLRPVLATARNTARSRLAPAPRRLRNRPAEGATGVEGGGPDEAGVRADEAEDGQHRGSGTAQRGGQSVGDPDPQDGERAGDSPTLLPAFDPPTLGSSGPVPSHSHGRRPAGECSPAHLRRWPST